MSVLAKILDLVDSIIVITIKGEKRRQEQTAKILETHGLPFQFFFGADFRECSIDQLVAEKIYSPSENIQDQNHFLTTGEIGCAVSHRKVAEKIVAGEFHSVLVLEDDVMLLEQNLQTFEASIKSVPVDWNLLYPGYNKQNLAMPLSIRLKLFSWYPLRYWSGSEMHNPSTIRNIYRRRYNPYWYRAGCFNGTHAYIIDTVAAKYLVDLQTPVSLQSDAALRHLVRFSNLNSYCLRYDVFDQRWDCPSLIGDRPTWN